MAKALKVLTVRFIESVKPGSAQADHRDGQVRGLMLRVSEHGTKSFCVQYKRLSDGRTRRVTLGQFPIVGLQEARELALDVQRRARKGEDPAGDKKAWRASDTFQDLAETWVQKFALKEKVAAARADDELMLKKDILPAIGGMKANEVTRRDVMRLVDAVSARGANVRANRVLALVKAIYRWGIEKEHVTVDPARDIKADHKEEPRTRVLSDAEIKALWFNLDTALRSEAVRLILRLCLVTGQRRQEVSGIEVMELNLYADIPVWTIPGDKVIKGKRIKGRPKNGLTHEVPLTPMAVGLLRQALELRQREVESVEPSEPIRWLFPNLEGSGPIDPHVVTRGVSRMRTGGRLNLDDFTVHDLRRTAATGMGKLGHRAFVGNVLNHKPENITDLVYNHAEYRSEKLAALTDWSRHLAGILEIAPAVSKLAPFKQTVLA